MERLHKFLARAGIASRRAAEQLIVDGKVKVNGETITTLGTQVDGNKDLIVVAGQPVTASTQRKYFLFYKPPGVVTTLSDPQGRPTVADYTKVIGSRVFPVGRLDFDAEGALLLTDDGDLANKLMHPSNQVPRVYLAKVKGDPDGASLKKLVEGVRLEDGMAHATEARIFEKAERNTWLKLIVTEGRQHLVKRLCSAIGHPVVRLFRPAHAGLPVHGLKPGDVRELSSDEVARVKRLAEGEQQPEAELRLPARRHGHAAPGFEDPSEDAPVGRMRAAPSERKSFGDRKRFAAGASPEGGARKAYAARGGEDRKSFGDRAGGDRKSFGDRKPFGDRAGADRKSFSDRKPFGDRAGGDRKSSGDRKPFGDRAGGGDRKAFGDRKPFGDRAGGADRKSFGDRGEGKPGGERKSFGDRTPRERKPFGERKSYGDRPSGERKPFGERKSFGDRPAGERKPFGERKSFGDRPTGERKPFGERKSFGDRPAGERKPFGERKSYGDRPSSERKPFGERKSYGDRPAGERKFGERKSFSKPGGAGRTFGKPGGGRPGAGGRGPRSAGPRRDSRGGKPRGSF